MRKIIVLTLTFLFATIGLKAQVELTSTGTGGSYSLSVPGAFQLRDGIQVTFKAHVNSAAGATMNVSGSGNVSIVKDGGANALAAGDIIVGQVVTLAYADAKWQMITPTGTPAVASNDWSLTGNAISAGNQLGTTNAFDLSIIAGGTAAITIDDVSQNIGIGVVPSTFYKIYTNIPVSNTTTTTAHEIQHNYSGASTKTGVSSVVSANGTGLKRAFYGFASATGSQQTDGFYSLIDNDGTGDAHGVYNDFSLSTGSGAQEGMRNIISNAGTSFKRGIFTSINQSGGANTSDMTGVHNSITSSSTASQDMFGILNQLTNNSSSGTTYGIYQTFSGTSSGTQYGIYASGEDQNYFSGNLGVGIPSPAQKLHIEGGRLRVANGASNADLYQSGSNTLLVTSGQFQIHANGTGPEFTIDDGNANFYVPLLIQDGSQANNRVLTSDASGNATWTDLSALLPASIWTENAASIYPTNWATKKVGVGTNSPVGMFDVTTSTLARGSQIQNSFSTTAAKFGIYAIANGGGTGDNNGGWFDASGNGTGINYGVGAQALGTAGENRAVYGAAVGGTTNWAGYFAAGNVYIQNNLGVGTTVPDGKLHLAETKAIYDGSDGAFAFIQNTDATVNFGQLAGIKFRTDGVSAGANARYKGGIVFQKTGSWGVGDLLFLTNTAGNNASVTAADEKMRITSIGNVGIGITPTQKLHVNGNVLIPAANDYMYATAKTNYNSISPVAFIPESSTYFRNSVSGYINLSGGTFPTTGEVHAPVYLPNGAVITEVRFYIYDNDATYDFVYLQLFRYTMSSGAGIFSSVAIPTGTFGITSYATTPNYTVDNSLYQYMIRIGMPQNSTNHRLYGVRITYTVTNAD